MIPRYSRPEMAQVWSEQGKFEKWLEVEIAACEAWAEQGAIPQEDLEKIRHASFKLDDINRYMEITRHDVTAFLRSVADSLGEESRWVHLGLTSSDVWDTATGLQIREAAEILGSVGIVLNSNPIPMTCSLEEISATPNLKQKTSGKPLPLSRTETRTPDASVSILIST